MRLIDGLVTKDEIYRLISGFRTRFKISEEAGHEMAKRVAELPTIKAEPVKHGRWEYDHTIGGMKHYRCTNCKNSGNECIADENEILWWNFCPRCGCKLDFGDDNDD